MPCAGVEARFGQRPMDAGCKSTPSLRCVVPLSAIWLLVFPSSAVPHGLCLALCVFVSCVVLFRLYERLSLLCDSRLALTVCVLTSRRRTACFFSLCMSMAARSGLKFLQPCPAVWANSAGSGACLRAVCCATSSVVYLCFHPTAAKRMHALKDLACRKRVAQAT
jgi:hypothetical protein